MRGRARAIGLLLGVATLLPASSAAAGLADRVGATFALMAADFIKAFQPLEGIVVDVAADLIYLDLGEAVGAQVGQEFTVFRKGNVFTHPLTGKPLGRYEEVLGWAQVRRVLARFSEAAFVPAPGKPAPRAEDGVRITRGRIKVAITPVLDLTRSKADVRRVPYLFATVLERSKRFQVIDPLAVTDMFANGSVRVEEMLARPERATRAARNLEVAGWLVPVLIERRGVTYLDATWISAVTGTALFSRRQPILAAEATEEQRFPWEPRVED
ncbi:MAG: hypothetical protein HY727_21245 [Candidatus Rokubacteria bacterium]|nr:hypothetical protein [Candidatus Rokubacteria bacterium]